MGPGDSGSGLSHPAAEAFLAYTFGLRHAVDADHIAAIDNTTRKLMQDGQRPVAVGLLLARPLDDRGALTVLLAVSAGIISDMPAFQAIGGVIGTAVSAIFLSSSASST